MKRPRHGIKSTTPRVKPMQPPIHVPAITFPVQLVESIGDNSEQMSVHNAQHPNLIGDNGDESIANVFGFGAFTNKNNCIVYHDLTGSFPFMSLDGSVCFFVLYHYEANCILASPIVGLDNKSIFEAYKTRFRELEAKGFKPKLNIMDN